MGGAEKPEVDVEVDVVAARRWIPTLEAARTSDAHVPESSWWPIGRDNLLAEDPTEIHALAAVMLDARMATRESRVEQIDLPETLAERRVDAMPPPRDDYGTASHVVYEGLVDALPRRCTLCAIRPGLGPCSKCTGTGKVPLVTSSDGAATFVDCMNCDRGFVVCTRCEGCTMVVVARARFVDDRPQEIKHLYVPGELSAYDSLLERALERGGDLPACLGIDPRARREVRSAYRGVVAFEETTFLGHRFGDALDRARAALGGMSGDAEVVHQDVRVKAWPFLWLRWGKAGARGEALLAVLPDGSQATLVP